MLITLSRVTLAASLLLWMASTVAIYFGWFLIAPFGAERLVWFHSGIVMISRVGFFTLWVAPLGIVLSFTFWEQRQVHRKQRARRNQCAECGYDLRGGDSSQCPECGEPRAMAGTAAPSRERRALMIIASLFLIVRIAAIVNGSGGGIC